MCVVKMIGDGGSSVCCENDVDRGSSLCCEDDVDGF